MTRAPLRQAVLGGICLLVAGCSNPEAGMAPSGGAATSAANPPSSLAMGRSIPAASSTFPTGHSSSSTPTASSKQPLLSTAQASVASSAKGSRNSDGNLPDAPDSDQGNSSSSLDGDSNFDNLEILDASLKGKLAVLRVGSDPAANNLMSVFVGLKNKTSRPLPLEVQTIYKDNTGNPLNDGSWVPMTLKSHEETEYRSASISTQATEFLVRIRRAPANETN